MVWFKVDDGFFADPKIAMLGEYRDEALALWVVAGSWSGRYLTDGVIYPEQVERLGFSVVAADALFEAGLWERDDLGIYTFHDWEQYQPTRADVDRKKEVDRRRKEDARRPNPDTKGQSPPGLLTDTEGNPEGVRSESNAPVPVPEPLLTPSLREGVRGGESSSRGTRLPEDWEPSAEVKSWARTNAPSVDLAAELEAFRDFWNGVPGARGRKSDWDGTLRNRLRDQHARNVSRGWKPEVDPGDEWKLFR